MSRFEAHLVPCAGCNGSGVDLEDWLCSLCNTGKLYKGPHTARVGAIECVELAPARSGAVKAVASLDGHEGEGIGAGVDDALRDALSLLVCAMREDAARILLEASLLERLASGGET